MTFKNICILLMRLSQFTLSRNYSPMYRLTKMSFRSIHFKFFSNFYIAIVKRLYFFLFWHSLRTVLCFRELKVACSKVLAGKKNSQEIGVDKVDKSLVANFEILNLVPERIYNTSETGRYYFNTDIFYIKMFILIIKHSL